MIVSQFSLVSAGILLALLSGNKGNLACCKGSDMSVLLVGPPGLGKSALLKQACELSFPNSCLVSPESSASLFIPFDKDARLLTDDPFSAYGGILCVDDLHKYSDLTTIEKFISRSTIWTADGGAKKAGMCTVQGASWSGSLIASILPHTGQYK